MFTHHHTFGVTGGDQLVCAQCASECQQSIKNQFSEVFSEPEFPIVCDDSVRFEYRIRLNDKGAAPPGHKIYPLDYEELAEL